MTKNPFISSVTETVCRNAAQNGGEQSHGFGNQLLCTTEFRRCSHCARHHTTSDDVRCRTMSSGVAEIQHIDLTALFIYRTMSYDTRTARQFTCKSCRTTSDDIGRHRTTSSGVVESSYVVRHRASRHPALSYDVVRSVNTALVSTKHRVLSSHLNQFDDKYGKGSAAVA